MGESQVCNPSIPHDDVSVPPDMLLHKLRKFPRGKGHVKHSVVLQASGVVEAKPVVSRVSSSNI